MMFEDHRNLYAGKQSNNGAAYAHTDNYRYEAAVKRDAYVFQSYGKVSAWTEDKGWKVIATLPIEDLRSHGHKYVAPQEEWSDAMHADLDRLLELGLTILEPTKG